MNSSWIAIHVLWQTAGWTMLHFLWVGGLFAVVAALINRAVGHCSPDVRYLVAVTQFFIVATIPCCLFIWNLNGPLGTPQPALVTTAGMETIRPLPDYRLRDGGALLHTTETLRDVDREDGAGVAFSRVRDTSLERLSGLQNNINTNHADSESPLRFITRVGATAKDWLMAILPWIWLIGFPLTCSTLLIGISGAERLRFQCQILSGTHPVVAICGRLQAALNMRKGILIGVTDSISAPILVGIVRPLILFPASTLAGISTEQLEMILLHELAHVRRWDNLINLMQRCVEAVLFFHPIIWWLSNRVRLEREHCCDAAVLAYVSAPQAYAEMLVQMALAKTPPAWVMGTSVSHQLIPRIRRILNQEEDRMQVSRKMVVASLSALISFAILTVVYAQRDPVKPPEKPPTVAADVKVNAAPEKAGTVSVAKQEEEPKKLDKVQEPLDPKQREKSIIITGTVLKPDGQPAPRSQVWLAGMTRLVGSRYGAAQVAYVRADDDGKFEFWHPRWRDRNYESDEFPILWAYARTEDGVIAPSVSLDLVREYQDKTGIHGLELKVGAKANYSGRVVDQNGRPIASTKITPLHLVLPSTADEKTRSMRLTDEMGALLNTVTDSDGKFTLMGLPESKAIFAKIEAPSAVAKEVHWATKAEPEVRLAADGTIRGKMTNMPASDFAERVELLITSVGGRNVDQSQPQFSFTTKFRPKADGTFEIAGVPPGSYELFVSPKESDRTIPQEFSIPVKCESKSGQTTESIELKLPSVIVGHGRVVDDKSGAPVAGATIMFLRQLAYRSHIGSAITDAKGEYRAYFLPGKIVIEPGKAPKDYLPPPDDRPYPAIEYTKNFEGPTFKYQRADIFRGTVVNEEGRPVPGAEIRWIQPDRPGLGLPKTITSDESGRFEISQVDPLDPLPIRVRSPQGVSVAVVLQPNGLADPKPILVSPKNAFRVKGTLVNRRGNPVPNVAVTVHWHRHYVSTKTRMSGLSSEIEKVKTNELGQFESSGFWGIDGYHVVIEADGVPRMDLKQVTGESGRTHDYGNVQLIGTSGFVHGKVVDPSGKPLSQVKVYNSGDAEEVIGTKTDDKGQFQLSGLLDGPVYVFAEQAKYRMAGAYVSDPSKDVVLTLIPSSDPPASRPEFNLESLDAIRQQNADQLAEWIKANNLTFRPNLRDHTFNALARTDPDEALKQIEKQSKAMDQRSAMVIARSLTPEQPRKKTTEGQDVQEIKTALRFAERAASRIGDLSLDRQISLKAAVGVRFLRLGDSERGKPLIESAAKGFAESKPPVEHFAISIAQGFAWYDIPRALGYLDKVKDQDVKENVRSRVIVEVARYNVPKALELLNAPTHRIRGDGSDDYLKLELVNRIGKIDPHAATKLIDGIANFRTKAEAAGWAAVAVAGENPALASSLIDQAMETLQAHRTPGSQSFYYGWLPGVAANLAVQAKQVKYPDMESMIQRVLSLRIPANEGTSSISRYQSTVNAALLLAFIDPVVARRLLADLEPELNGNMLGNGGIESVGMNQWLFAWVVADPEHATVLLKAEMEKSRGSKEPPYWINNAYTLLSLPKTAQLEFVREYGNVDVLRLYSD